MSFASDDLAPLVAQQPQGELAGYAQGTILSWDPDTFENVISVRGGTLTNVQVGSGVEAMTYRPGDTVILARWRPGGGMGTWWIDRRIIRPGTGSAGRAISFMQGTLAKQVAAAVFAERITVAVADGQVSTTSDDWVELSGGPEIADVEVSETGIAIVFISANVFGMADLTEGGVVGLMSVKVSGATVVAPLNRWQFGGRSVVLPGNENTVNMLAAGTRVAVFNELNPGLHTFTAVYQTGTGFPEVNFNGRSMAVIAL